MLTSLSLPRAVAGITAAALATALVASILQTQLNLHALAALGMQVPLPSRLLATLEDLGRFGPVMFGIALGAHALAVPCASLLRRAGVPALLAGMLASVALLGVILYLMRSVIPMPAIAATREVYHLCLMAATAAVGAWAGVRVAALPAWHRLRTRGAWTVIVLALALPAASFLLLRPAAATLPPLATDYQVHTVVDGLVRPWSMAFLPDGTLLVTEMAGRLLRIDPQGGTTEIGTGGLPAIHQHGGTIGLMEVAPDPGFADNGLVYLTMGYQNAQGIGVRLVRAQLADNALQQVTVLFESTPKPSPGNNGGRLAFLPGGALLITVGDGSARREEAQNPNNSLGKVMRIANPRAARAPASLYTLGHRNPQGIVLDPVSGAVFVSEHGPRGGDELNRLRAGANYGWPLVTGGIDYPFARVSPFRHADGLQTAEYEWTPSIAPAGLTVYQGALFPGWHGDFLVPALKLRGIRRLVRDGERIVAEERLLAERDQRIRDVRSGPDGAVYALTDGVDAALLRLTPR